MSADNKVKGEGAHGYISHFSSKRPLVEDNSENWKQQQFILTSSGAN